MTEVIGSHQTPVWVRLANAVIPNVHRVLKLGGEISSDFRRPDPNRADHPLDVLKAEGSGSTPRGVRRPSSA